VARQLARALPLAGVNVKRAAAGLLLRRRDAMALLLQEPDRRAVGLAERLAHHASGEDRDVGIRSLAAAEGRALRPRRERCRPPQTAAEPHPQANEPEPVRDVGESSEKREPPLM